ncbi:CBS domain-containing protein (plasmid) [Agrobacterium vitis]|uniref:CBS domain-containing protein n=2 Tax=Agrobacterium vitis TaxID=373 RepID=UPI003D2C60E3
MMLTVQSIMSSDPIVVGPQTRIWEAANVMLDCGFSGLPVVDADGVLLGIISESDFLRRDELKSNGGRGFWRTLFSSRGALAEDYAKAFGKLVNEVMTSPAVSVAPETTIDDAAFRMADHNIKRLPVVHNDKVVGIVTRSDIMRALIKDMAAKSAERLDADIKGALLAELDRQRWGDAIIVSVANAVVTLEGRVLDEREKTAARVAAENTSGVTRVVDDIRVAAFPDMPVSPPGF